MPASATCAWSRAQAERPQPLFGERVTFVRGTGHRLRLFEHRKHGIEDRGDMRKRICEGRLRRRAQRKGRHFQSPLCAGPNGPRGSLSNLGRAEEAALDLTLDAIGELAPDMLEVTRDRAIGVALTGRDESGREAREQAGPRLSGRARSDVLGWGKCM